MEPIVFETHDERAVKRFGETDKRDRVAVVASSKNELKLVHRIMDKAQASAHGTAIS